MRKEKEEEGEGEDPMTLRFSSSPSLSAKSKFISESPRVIHGTNEEILKFSNLVASDAVYRFEPYVLILLFVFSVFPGWWDCFNVLEDVHIPISGRHSDLSSSKVVPDKTDDPLFCKVKRANEHSLPHSSLYSVSSRRNTRFYIKFVFDLFTKHFEKTKERGGNRFASSAEKRRIDLKQIADEAPDITEVCARLFNKEPATSIDAAFMCTFYLCIYYEPAAHDAVNYLIKPKQFSRATLIKVHELVDKIAGDTRRSFVHKGGIIARSPSFATERISQRCMFFCMKCIKKRAEIDYTRFNMPTQSKWQ